MDIDAGVTSGVVGLVVGFPAAGLAWAVPAEGRPVLPARWWAGGGMPPAGVGAVATTAGVAGAGVGLSVGWSWALPAYVLSAVMGVVLAVVDVRRNRLPYVLTAPTGLACLVCFGVVAAVAQDFAPLVRSVTAGAAALGVFLVLALAFAGQLGLGDVVLAGWLAMSLGWLGWQRVLIGLLAGLVAQVAAGVALMVWRRVGMRDPVPMGPALLAGWLVGVMIGVA